MSLAESKEKMPNEAKEIGGGNHHEQVADTMSITLFLKL